MSLSRDLAERTAALRFADLPQDAVYAAKTSLADGLAVMLAAIRLEPATAAFASHAVALGGTPEAMLLGRRERVTAPLAALANGALSHAIDFEDTFDATGVHPSAVVIPVVLALAERQNAAAEDVLLALAIGCDAVCRLSLAMSADPASRGWYFPPMLGALGATLAAARLMDLSPEACVDALSLTACQFALTDELTRAPNAHLRAIRDGFAARAAVEAVLLAARGVKGVDLPLEGKSGVFAILTGAPPDEVVFFERWGTHFYGPSVTVKPWPSCRGTHASIAAGLALRDEGLAPDDIASAVFDVAQPDDMLLEPLTQRQFPRTAIDAKFSIPFTFATALIHGHVGLADFEDLALRDGRRLSLAQAVTLGKIVSDTPRLFLTLHDGTRRELALDLPPPLLAGSVTRAALLPKLEACLVGTGSLIDSTSLLDACLGLDRAGVAPLLRVLAGSARDAG